MNINKIIKLENGLNIMIKTYYSGMGDCYLRVYNDYENIIDEVKLVGWTVFNKRINDRLKILNFIINHNKVYILVEVDVEEYCNERCVIIYDLSNKPIEHNEFNKPRSIFTRIFDPIDKGKYIGKRKCLEIEWYYYQYISMKLDNDIITISMKCTYINSRICYYKINTSTDEISFEDPIGEDKVKESACWQSHASHKHYCNNQKGFNIDNHDSYFNR